MNWGNGRNLMARSDIVRLTDGPEEMRAFQQERLVVEITELMCKAMHERGMKRGQLAEQLGKTKGRITQILNGETNLTLHTVADVFTALGKTLTVSVQDVFVEQPVLQWVGMVVAQPPLNWNRIYDIKGSPVRTSGNLQIAG